MKKIIFGFLLLTILQSCGLIDIRNNNLQRPQLENSRSLVMNQTIFVFQPIYKVYTPEYGAFLYPEDRKDGMLFDVCKKYDLFNDIFIIKDLKQKKELHFTQLDSNNKGRDVYRIYDNSTDIAIIEQVYNEHYNEYTMKYGAEIYDIKLDYKERNPKSPHAKELHSIEMSISKDNNTYIKVFKEQYYFKNNIEIFINEDFAKFDDLTAVSIGVYFDYLLKSTGINYRD